MALWKSVFLNNFHPFLRIESPIQQVKYDRERTFTLGSKQSLPNGNPRPLIFGECMDWIIEIPKEEATGDMIVKKAKIKAIKRPMYN
jgi:hypothetical protein